MDEQLVVKYIKTKNKVRKIVTYKEDGELRRYHQEVVKYLKKKYYKFYFCQGVCSAFFNLQECKGAYV